MIPEAASTMFGADSYTETSLSEAGLAGLAPQAWQKAAALIGHFDDCMEAFLALWTKYMAAAGYLDYTTAKRKDCIDSARALLIPIARHLAEERCPSFEWLRQNQDHWADWLVESGIRHWRRGIPGAMFLGCFKTFIQAMEDAVETLAPTSIPTTPAMVRDARLILRLYGRAFEVLWLETCLSTQRHEHDSDREALYRQMIVEKCRFENVLNTTADCVLVMDEECRVTTVNAALLHHAGSDPVGRYVWDVLSLEGENPEDFFRFYPLDHKVEVAPFGGETVFSISVAPMSGVSLAMGNEYLVLLTNITTQVNQREMLEEAIAKHTADIMKEKQQLEEMNITLRNVLRNANHEQEEKLRHLSDEVRRFLFPALARIGEEQDPHIRQGHIQVVRNQLERLLAGPSMADGLPAPANQSVILRKLTMTELRVCQMIQAGQSTKEIASLLKVSPETVQTHRKNIRRKLDIRGHDAQLAVALMAYTL